MGIVGGVGGGEQPSEVFIASSPAPVTINARTRPCEGMRMSVRPSCDHVAAQLDPPFGRTYCDVRTTERRFKLVRDLVETTASDGFQAGFGIADGVVDPSGRKALGGHHVELRQPAVLDGLRGFDEPAVDNTAHEGHAAQSAWRSPHAPLGSCRRDARHA